jgi:hypothetical protein
MALTIHDLKDRLKQINEVDLLELLDISSEDIVERFVDLIEDNFDKLEKEVE